MIAQIPKLAVLNVTMLFPDFTQSKNTENLFRRQQAGFHFGSFSTSHISTLPSCLGNVYGELMKLMELLIHISANMESNRKC